MSAACAELISSDKVIRDVTEKTFYPVTIGCDNMAAGKNTEMVGSHKLKDFDYPLETIQESKQAEENLSQSLMEIILNL